jgi:hypothetical protein
MILCECHIPRRTHKTKAYVSIQRDSYITFLPHLILQCTAHYTAYHATLSKLRGAQLNMPYVIKLNEESDIILKAVFLKLLFGTRDM